MAQITIGSTRLAQSTSGPALNTMFTELYGRASRIDLDASTSAKTFTVPAGYIIEHVAFINNTANAVTGGLKFGTTSGGTDVVNGYAVPANGVGVIPGASIALRLFSKTAPQTIYIDAVTSWNSANVDIHIILRKMWG